MSSDLLEQASRIIPNSQLLVTVVTKRVRQLVSGHRPLVEYGPRMGFADIALKEIIEGKLKFEQPSESLQQRVNQAAATHAPTLSGIPPKQ